jgi:hypothetical protein
MSDQPPAPPPEATPAGLAVTLHAVAEMLRDDRPLGLDARRALAELLDEIGRALGSAPVPPAEVSHLAESTAHFIAALRQPGEHVTSARERLEAALLGVEARAPVVAGVVRRFLDALANIGI